jgi:hypothetical protein
MIIVWARNLVKSMWKALMKAETRVHWKLMASATVLSWEPRKQKDYPRERLTETWKS